MEKLTLTDLQTALIVILALFSAVTVIDKGIAACKNLFSKGGAGMEKRIKTIEDKQTRDFARINDMDRQLHRVDDDMEHILNAMNAILMHEITGNGVDRMRRAKDELDAYISKRGTNAGAQKDD